MSRSLEKKLTAILRDKTYRPMNKSELARKLGLPPKDRAALRRILEGLEESGALIRGKKGRYSTPSSDGNVLVGQIRFQPKGHAFFMPDPDDPVNKATGRDLDELSRVFIPPGKTGTALTGDRVAVRLHEARAYGNARRSKDRRKGPKVRRAGEDTLYLEGRVTRVVARKTEAIVGTLHEERRFRYCVPRDELHPRTIELNPSPLDAEANPGDLIVVGLEEWNSPSAMPRGRITRVLGPPGAPGLDILTIIHKYGLPTDFPETVHREAAAVPGEVGSYDVKNREDWRDREVFTIDPIDAKDFDDAIAVRPLENGGWELAVHIADVSHYVRPGSALDKEARQRGNSVYLVDRVIPMLPENLSNGICSLRPDVDRLTRAVIMTFDEEGKQNSARFAAAVIHSAARLAYEEAYQILKPHLVTSSEDQHSRTGNQESAISNRQSLPSSLPSHLHTAWDLAATLRERRFKKGALDLDMPEVKVLLDKDGAPVDLVQIAYDESHQLIEEFMLAANESVARAVKNREFPSVYRIHEDPDEDKLFEFRELARIHNYDVGDLSNRAELQKLLKMIRGRPEERLIKIGLLKSLKRAVYHADPVGHYGLATIDYTHFTSPIRRYADLIVHRVLGNLMFERQAKHERRIAEKISVPSYPGLLEIAKHISDTERNAADAEEESKKLKMLEFFAGLARRDSERTFRALILEVSRMGIFVELEDFFLRGLVRREDFPPNGDWFFDLQTQRVYGRSPKVTYRGGDEVDVQVARVDLEKQHLDFRIVESR